MSRSLRLLLDRIPDSGRVASLVDWNRPTGLDCLLPRSDPLSCLHFSTPPRLFSQCQCRSKVGAGVSCSYARLEGEDLLRLTFTCQAGSGKARNGTSGTEQLLAGPSLAHCLAHPCGTEDWGGKLRAGTDPQAAQLQVSRPHRGPGRIGRSRPRPAGLMA